MKVKQLIPECFGAVIKLPEDECDDCPLYDWCMAAADVNIDYYFENRRYPDGLYDPPGDAQCG
jgi:hypothetical protein